MTKSSTIPKTSGRRKRSESSRTADRPAPNAGVQQLRACSQSNRQLAQLLGIDEKTVRGWLAGAVPGEAHTRSLEKMLGIRPDAWTHAPKPTLYEPPDAVVHIRPPQDSALVALREQRQRLEEAVSDPELSRTQRFAAERLLTGCLRSIGLVEEAWRADLAREFKEISDAYRQAAAKLPHESHKALFAQLEPLLETLHVKEYEELHR